MFFYLGFKSSIRSQKKDDFRKYHEVIDIGKNVLVHSSDGSQKRVDLPCKFSSDNTYYFTFLAKPVSDKDGLYVYVKGAYFKFKLQCDNEVFYEYQPYDTDKIRSGGQILRFVKIPDKYLGKEILIEFIPALESSYGIRIPDIKLGTHNDLVMTARDNDILISFISLILMVFSMEGFVLILVLIINKKAHIRALLIPLFSYTIAEYIVISSASSFFLFPKGIFIYAADYILLMLTSISLIIFLISMAFKYQYAKWQIALCQCIALVSILNLLIQAILTYLGYSEFMAMQKITHMFFILQFITFLLMAFSHTSKSYTKNSRRYLFLAVGVNVVFFIVFIEYYYSSSLNSFNVLGIIGIIFVIFELSIALKMYAKTYKEYYISELNKEIALIDNLTMLGNRNAFEKEIKKIEEYEYDTIILMEIDINNLKEINDRYGHPAGDKVISALGEIIHAAHKKFDKIKAFRIGGDEFMMIADNVTLDYAKKIEIYIHKKAEEYREKYPDVPFSFGFGYDILRGSDNVSLIDFICHVDEKMYQDKKRKKGL